LSDGGSMKFPAGFEKELEAYFSQKENVSRVYFFDSQEGSVRRANLDLLIVVKDAQPHLERLDEFRDLLDKYPRDWNVLVWTEEEFERGKNCPFMREILEQAKVIRETR